MRLGLLADIHGDVGNLSRAIERLWREGVDKFVLLGDVIYDARDADETVELLKSCDAVGVWGNHELGLCVESEDDVRELYSDSVMQFFSMLEPRLELGDVLVSHTFPTEDPRDVFSYYVGEPDDDDLLRSCFATFPHRIIVNGHFHRWFASTPAGRLDWRGEDPLFLPPTKRYFIVINAVMNGFTAVLDDQQNVLVPIEL